MSSLLGPKMVNAFLCHYEKIWFNKCPPQFKPATYTHYVGEIFVLFKSKENFKIFVNYVNTKNKNIKFTFEAEDLNSLSFLDIRITRKNKLLLWFFAKPHFVEVLL